MKPPFVALFFVCIFATLSAGGNSLALASDLELQGESLAGEIQNLSTSIDRLAKLLEEQSKAGEKQTMFRKLDMAIAYLNFRSRRIEMLERDVRAAKNTKDRLEDILRHWQHREKQYENKIRNSPRSTAEETEQSREDAEYQSKTILERMTRLDGEIVALENRIAELQNQIDGVESFVHRNLEL